MSVSPDLQRVLDAFDQLLEAQVERDGCVVKLLRGRHLISRRLDRDGSRNHMPDAAAIVANFDGILGACLFDGYVPIPGFKRHANFGLQSLFAFIDTQEGRSARMPRDIDVPIGEEPMRLLRDEKNCVRAVASRKLSKAVEIDGPCGEAAELEQPLCSRSVVRSRA